MDKNEINKCKNCVRWNEGTLSCDINTSTVWGAEDYCSKHKVNYTCDYFRKMMDEIAHAPEDPETKHYEADRLMIAVLNQLGYDKGTKIFESMEKWYS